MFGIGSKHRGFMPVVVADIEDGGVGVAVVGLSATVPVHIWSAERVSLSADERSPDRAAATIAPHIAEAGEKALKRYMESDAGKEFGAPQASHAIIHSPWTHLRTAYTDTHFDEETTITKDVIAQLAHTALEAGSGLDRSKILEAGVMKVFLNGYPTFRPVGKKARTIGLVAFESDIDTGVRQQVSDALMKIVPGRDVSMHAGMRSFLTVLHEHLPDAPRYAIVDVNTNTTTSSVLLKEEVLEETSVPIGIATILKNITPSTGLPEETLTLLRMLENDSCSTPACEELKVALAKAEPEMVKTFAEMFAALARKRRLPNMCILSVKREFAPWLAAFFARIDFAQFTTTTQPLTVELLTPEHLTDAVTWAGTVTPDTNLGVASACVNILMHAEK